jgi:Fur family zinc uptake transcriptional regulator
MTPININATIARVEQNWRLAGVKLTEKGKNVLVVLLNAKILLSACALAEQHKVALNESLSAMLIYRMLDFLV